MVTSDGSPTGPEDDQTETAEVDLGPLDLDFASPVVGPARPVERTRALLAYLLFGLLAGIIVVLLGLLALKRITTPDFGMIGGVLIAPVVGLLGAATGYYYGRGDR
jgi:hypothetical protein